MSPQNAMNFTALLLITQSLQATPTAVATFSQPAIEMVQQAADEKPSSFSSGSLSSSLARFRLRRKRTASSFISEPCDEAAETSDSSEDTSCIDSSLEEDMDSRDYHSPEFDMRDTYSSRESSRTCARPELQRTTAKLSKKVDPRDFIKTGMSQCQPPNTFYSPPHHHHHHHHHYYHHHQEPQY